MRNLSIAVLLVGLLASAPAAAQTSSPGRVYYNSSPGTGAPPTGVYDPAGPVYHNQSGAPIPGAPSAHVSSNPPHFNQARPMPSPNRPRYNGQHGNAGRWGGNVGGRWWGGAQAPGGWGAYRRPMRGFTLPAYWMASDFLIDDFADFGLRAPGRGYFWVRYYDDAVLVDAGGRVWDSVGGIAWADADAYAGDGYAAADAQAYAGTGGGYRQPIAPVDPNQYYEPRGGYAPPVAGGPPAVQYQGYPDAGVTYGNNVTYGGGYYAPGTTTTTVVIQPATTITTTTVEEVTTYVSRPRVVHRVYHRPKPRCCACGCR